VANSAQKATDRVNIDHSVNLSALRRRRNAWLMRVAV